MRILNCAMTYFLTAALWAPLVVLGHSFELPFNPISVWIVAGIVMLSHDARDYTKPEMLGLTALLKAAAIAPAWPLLRRHILSSIT